MLEHNEWEKVKGLSDKELGDRISIAVKALGGGKGNLTLSEKDMEKIKNAVRGMDLADINSLMGKIDPIKAEKIKEKMTENG